MLLKIKKAFISYGVSFNLLSTFISKTFFTVIKHPAFILFCKLVFFTAIILKLKNDIDVLTRALESTREELLQVTKNLKFFGVRFVQYRNRTEDQLTALKKVLENVKTPIVGTFTAGKGISSKIVSNRPPR